MPSRWRQVLAYSTSRSALLLVPFSLAKRFPQENHIRATELPISEVFDREFRLENRALDMHISNLRRKLGQHSLLIVTVQGIGYSLRVPEIS